MTMNPAPLSEFDLIAKLFAPQPHFQAKWAPVRVKKMRSGKTIGAV